MGARALKAWENAFFNYFAASAAKPKKARIGLEIEHFIVDRTTKEAVSYYEKASKKNPNEFTTPMILSKLGDTYQIMGNESKALETYKTLKKDFPNSNEAFEISKKIAYLEQKMK